MASVSLKNLTKRWGSFVGVDNQSLDIADREFLVLLGPSGCGKTTTMRMIAGLEDPTDGQILIGGEVVNHALPKDRDIAVVFQNYGLYPHMSVFDNIAYPLKVRGTQKNNIKPRVEAAAEQVELSGFLDRKPKELSGGQRQRVALARAIVRTPKVFLMDEPLSNLDAKLRVSMRDGVIQQLGTPDDIYNDPDNLFVSSFIGSPAMNLVSGSVRDGHFITTNGVPHVTVKADDRSSVVLGVRADDVSIAEAGHGHIDATVYAFQNTGENTLRTVQWGEQRIIVRGHRHLRKEQDEIVGITLDPQHLQQFDPDTGKRLRSDDGVG